MKFKTFPIIGVGQKLFNTIKRLRNKVISTKLAIYHFIKNNNINKNEI